MTTDKRVFEVAARVLGDDGQAPRTLAISADSTILDLHLALLGAFRWAGDYAIAEQEYRVTVGKRVFEFGKGSRTPLRRLLALGTSLQCDTFETHIAGEVTNTYEVPSRRHYPKVLDGGGAFDEKLATWKAQAALRRELRGLGAPRPDAGDNSELFEARLHGFFSALVSGPLILPSEWLAQIATPSSFRDENATRDMVSTVMDVHNAVARELHEEQEAFTRRVGSFASIANGAGLIEWSRGYFSAVELRAEEWERFVREDEFRTLFTPLALVYYECGKDAQKRKWLTDEAFRNNLARSCAVAAIGIRYLWRRRLLTTAEPQRRSQPKISPNAPCPCGSGKKYKRCCSPLRVIGS